MKNIAFFDFDGTITTKDTLFYFIYNSFSPIELLKKTILSLPFFIAYKLKLLSDSLAKEKIFTIFFKNMSYDDFVSRCENFCKNSLDSLIRAEVLKKILSHQKNGDKVVIVSASIENWIIPWAKKYDIEVISTKIEVLNGRLTGRFSTKNCYGIEKVNRIKQRFDLKDYKKIYAYGDSKGDEEMLKMVN